MSNQTPPPPKPKPGSLRDRIAAFENKPASTPADRPAPAPRPKPGGLAWKPRAPSPSSPPKASAISSESSHIPERRTMGGMSASDAKESIGLGGSLKDRMAALQGKGAFGGIPSAATVPLKQAAEKPKWKPPPVVSPPTDESEGDSPVGVTHQSVQSPPLEPQQSAGEEAHKAGSAEESVLPLEGDEEAEEPNPEEEERQRRAAIAARMARLGGARVGMAPPVFGRKPSVKKTETPKDEEAPAAESTDVASPGDQSSLKSPIEGISGSATSDKAETEVPTDYFAGAQLRKSSTSSSLLSTDSVSQSSKSPSMPIPSVPRRAAPPRKKAAKSSSQGTGGMSESQEDTSEQSTNITHDAIPLTEEILNTEKQSETDEQQEGVRGTVGSSLSSEEHHVTGFPAHIEGGAAEASDAEQGAGTDDGTREPELNIGKPEKMREASFGTSASAEKGASSVESAPVETQVEIHTAVEPVRLPTEQEVDDEEEAARRKRVAEKLAKMGGINPFAPRPPLRSLPTDSELETQDGINPEVDDHFVTTIPAHFIPTTHSEEFAAYDPTASDIASSTLESSLKIDSDKAGIVLDPAFPEDLEDDLSLPTSHHTSEASEEDHDRDLGGEEFDREILGRYKFHEGLEEQLGHIYEKTSGSHTNEKMSRGLNEDDTGDEDERVPPRINRPIPPLPVSIMSSQPDPSHRRSTSQGSIRPLPQPPRVALATVPLPETKIEDQDYDVTPRPSYRPIPPVPVSVDDELAAMEEPSEQQIPPAPPLRRLPLPPRRQSGTQTGPPGFMSQSQKHGSSPPPPPLARPVPPALHLDSEHEREILDDDEGDPIDPSFHRYSRAPPSPPNFASSEMSSVNYYPSSSPTSCISSNRRSLSPSNSSPRSSSSASITSPFQLRYTEGAMVEDHSQYGNPRDTEVFLPTSQTSNRMPQTALEQAPVPKVGEEEDYEQSRRRTIAERMAKLGGIKFGAPPPVGRAPPGIGDALSEQSECPSQEDHLQEVQLTEEEEEYARKQRIASKLAGMGGVGMFGAPQPPNRRQESDEITATNFPTPAPPSHHATPPFRIAPTLQRRDSNFDPDRFENDTQAEADGSKLKEYNPDHMIEQEVPPPVPSRGGRRLSGGRLAESVVPSPPRKTTLSPRRPPIPSVPANVVARRSSLRKSSVDHTPPKSRVSSFDISRASPVPRTDYVMVEEPGSEGSMHPVPSPNSERSTLEWEIPSIPTSLTFDGPQLDLSLSSWSDGSISYPAAQASQALPVQQEARGIPSQIQSKPATDIQLSSEELMAAWGRVGVQLCESATTMFERSKKSHIGDGSYRGFVLVVFSQVPNARPPSESGYGYLIYAQTGSAVQRRVCDIMPGDVVALFDVKLKGHKGLQLYNQHVGAAEPLVGIVSEFEPKKSKIKVFHANQHVGQQTVESVSYRLDDIKSGTVKIFRALEA